MPVLSPSYRNLLRIDPSRTGLLRRAFYADLKRRFGKVQSAVWKLIVTDDAFGLRRPLTTNFDPDEPRDEKGEWTSEGGHAAEMFVSPNTESIDFDTATSRLRSSQQANTQKALADVDKEMGLSASHVPVIGAWRDGAENSTLTHIRSVSKNELRVTGAMKGLLTNQKQVLVFHHDRSGDGFLAHFPAKGTLSDIHANLLKQGLEFHSIVPDGKDRAIIYAYGSSHEELALVKKVGGSYGQIVKVRTGTGEFIGTQKSDGTDAEQREDARRTYLQIIHRGGEEGVLGERGTERRDRDYSSIWRRLHARHKQTLTLNAPSFKFETDDNKLKKFNAWLKKQIDDGILEVAPVSGEPIGQAPWLSKYVNSAYKKGALATYIKVKPELLQKQPFYEGSKAQFLESAFGRPERVSKLRLLHTRAFENLKGVTSTMASQMNRQLADGLAHGKGPMEIARGMSKTISGLTKTRARAIAATELVHAQAEGALDGMEDLGIETTTAEVEFSTAGDDLVCPICQDLEGETYTIEEARGVIPVHPNCLTSHKTKIYTENGWRGIGMIKEGDYVLTHKGRFAKVLKTFRYWVPKKHLVTFWIGKDVNGGLTVTSDHPVLVNGQWIKAGAIKVGDRVSCLSTECLGCGKKLPMGQQYCNQVCQWKNPKHKANVSEKNRQANLRQYASGERNRHTIALAARAALRKLIQEDSTYLKKTPEQVEAARLVLQRPEVRLKISLSKRGDKNPMRKYPALRRRHRKIMRLRYREHPELHLNAILAKKARHRTADSRTWIERVMGNALEDIGLGHYVYNHPVDGLWIDYAYPDKKVGIECDGEHWHRDKVKEAKRNYKLQRLGWKILHFSGKEIKRNVTGCAKTVCRVLGNHAGEYKFDDFEVIKIAHKDSKKVTLYNLSVFKDESYIAKGFVVHNCRCSWSPVVQVPSLKRK